MQELFYFKQLCQLIHSLLNQAVLKNSFSQLFFDNFKKINKEKLHTPVIYKASLRSLTGNATNTFTLNLNHWLKVTDKGMRQRDDSEGAVIFLYFEAFDNENSYSFIQNKMFNYFVLAPANTYSLSSFTTEAGTQPDPPKEPQISQEEYSKLLERYDQLKAKYQRVKQENSQLKDYVSELEDVFQPDPKRKKIKRRTECELSKEHACPYPNCKKDYASPLALNLHIRNKHEGGTKKERIAFIKQLLEAEELGREKPVTKLKLCPELFEIELKSYRQKIQQNVGESSKNLVKQNVSSELASDE